MADTSVAQRRRCAICGETATKQVEPSIPRWETRNFRDGAREEVGVPGPADLCLTHYNEVAIARTRNVGLCLRCQAWRPTGSACPKCGSALITMGGVHRWNR